jgi:hypothetical protein
MRAGNHLLDGMDNADDSYMQEIAQAKLPLVAESAGPAQQPTLGYLPSAISRMHTT